MDCPLDKILPCMQEEYKGTSNYKKNHCLEKNKCEYLNGMYNFIFQCYPQYVVTECCDVKSNNPYPEAILTNLENNSTIAIEMKCFPDKVYENVKKTENRSKQEATFWKKIIDQCAINAQNEIEEYLYKMGIEDKSNVKELLSIIFWRMNIKIISKCQESVQMILMKNKHHNSQMEFLSNSMVLYSKNIFMDLIKKCNFSLIKSFENDELEVIIYLGNNDKIYFEVYDNSVINMREINQLNTDGITDYLKKFIEGCEKNLQTLLQTKIFCY